MRGNGAFFLEELQREKTRERFLRELQSWDFRERELRETGEISREQLERRRVQLEVEGIPGDFREGGGAFSGAGKANKTLLQKGIFRYGCN